MAKTEPRSPWQRKQKVKFQYSRQLLAFENAVKNAYNPEVIRELAREHTNMCRKEFGFIPDTRGRKRLNDNEVLEMVEDSYALAA